MWKVVGAPCRADSDREAGRAPTGPLGDRGNPRGMPPTFPSKSHLQSLHHHPLPAAVHLTVKTTAPVVSQTPYLLLDLRIFPTSFSYPSNPSAPSPCIQELYSFCTSTNLKQKHFLDAKFELKCQKYSPVFPCNMKGQYGWRSLQELQVLHSSNSWS